MLLHFISRFSKTGSTRNQEFPVLIGEFSGFDSTRNQEIPDFVGEFLRYNSTKTQDFFILVGTPTCFFPYESNGKGDLGGTTPLQSFHQNLRNPGQSHTITKYLRNPGQSHTITKYLRNPGQSHTITKYLRIESARYRITAPSIKPPKTPKMLSTILITGSLENMWSEEKSK